MHFILGNQWRPFQTDETGSAASANPTIDYFPSATIFGPLPHQISTNPRSDAFEVGAGTFPAESHEVFFSQLSVQPETPVAAMKLKELHLVRCSCEAEAKKNHPTFVSQAAWPHFCWSSAHFATADPEVVGIDP